MKLNVELNKNSYPIYIERNGIKKVSEYLNINRKIGIITDTGVPRQWVDLVAKQCPNHFIYAFQQGEASKNITVYEQVLQTCIENEMTRKDAIIAIGGGVVGDLSGFAAASYMRGIDFYNIPTTILSQVDSSVGGKVAIDMGSYKNIVGAFWQPKAVIIDPNVLSTLSIRQQHNGLMEALKMGLILEPELVDLFEQETIDIDTIITRSIDLKRQVVQQDETEQNLRKILNFGHTIGHAIEGAYGLDTYLHGECVAMGMLFFIKDQTLRIRIKNIFNRFNIPSIPAYDIDTLMNYIMHDKKSNSTSISVITVEKVGQYNIEEMSYTQIRHILERGYYEE